MLRGDSRRMGGRGLRDVASLGDSSQRVGERQYQWSTKVSVCLHTIILSKSSSSPLLRRHKFERVTTRS